MQTVNIYHPSITSENSTPLALVCRVEFALAIEVIAKITYY
jgi:hypothetical protein